MIESTPFAMISEANHLASFPPPPFNVKVSALPAGCAEAVRRAVAAGIDSCTWYGQVYVCRSDLEDMAGPGSDTFDPKGGCYIPDAAMIDHVQLDAARMAFRTRHPHAIC